MNAELGTLLGTLADQAQGLLATGFVVFLRVGAAMALLPAFGEQSVPARVRIALGLGLTVIVLPAVAGRVAPLGEVGTLSALPLATEVVAGLAIGLGLRLFVLALQMAGTIAAQATSLSQFFGGAGVEPQPAISQLLVVAGLALAVKAGLHVRVVELIVQSYDVIPPGRFPSRDALSGWGIAGVARAVSLAFSLAAPFILASLLYNVALGVINRAMPQLSVSFVGAPALSLGGLGLLVIVLPVALWVWRSALLSYLAAPFDVMP